MSARDSYLHQTGRQDDAVSQQAGERRNGHSAARAPNALTIQDTRTGYAQRAACTQVAADMPAVVIHHLSAESAGKTIIFIINI